LRCDANVSIRPAGATELGTRTEIKNINSFRFVEQAITYEIGRQREVLEGGGRVVQETRLYDAQAKVTRSMRSKEEAHDYRYFPEPDLPDLVLAPDFAQTVARDMPELPAAKRERYVRALGLSDYDAQVLTEDAAVARYFEKALLAHANAKALANWVINEVLREAKGKPLETLPLTPAALAELVALVDDNLISGKIAKDLFARVMEHGGSPKAMAREQGLAQVSDTSAIEGWVDEVLAANPEMVAKFKAGKVNVLGFLVGQVLKASHGAANPKLASEVLRRRLS
ncbi:MAG: Asp-tRNA(Asn)/Glu-tRNA(Gln) amidotransferase GatCAB subunit B, partial [Deltaproteobacteria bacterium]|nr:Asp-tRNA(Asn)/Glu-tRNA(Gln) amidotransferase GatCAB subunit B [Deltaproteobacteria bacterium]